MGCQTSGHLQRRGVQGAGHPGGPGLPTRQRSDEADHGRMVGLMSQPTVRQKNGLAEYIQQWRLIPCAA